MPNTCYHNDTAQMSKQGGEAALARIIDVNCAIGPFLSAPIRRFENYKDLDDESLYFGIDRVLAYHSYAVQADPVEGNQMIVAEAQRAKKLIPAWVALPDIGHETGPPEELLPQMQAHGVKAVRLFPKQHNYPVHPLNCSELFAILQDHRVPVLVPWAEITWDDLNWTCRTFPELPIILIEAEYGANRWIYPLLRAYPNVSIEISRYFIHEGLEDLCRHFGASRLVFGSSMPLLNPAAVLGCLHYAEISEEERARILGGNAQDLFSAIRW